jgi:hypothetical protein
MRINPNELPDLDKKEIENLLVRVPDFGYFGDNEELFKTWTLGPVVVHRDSGILDKSNAKALKHYLNEIEDLEVEETYEFIECNHWAVGWVEHLTYKVIDENNEPTKIARVVKDWFDYLENDYSIADEDLYSEMEWEATYENIDREIDYMFHRDMIKCTDEELAYVKSKVYEWFNENNDNALENRDDRGGCPSEEEFIECFKDLGVFNAEQNSCGFS